MVLNLVCNLKILNLLYYHKLVGHLTPITPYYFFEEILRNVSSVIIKPEIFLAIVWIDIELILRSTELSVAQVAVAGRSTWCCCRSFKCCCCRCCLLCCCCCLLLWGCCCLFGRSRSCWSAAVVSVRPGGCVIAVGYKTNSKKSKNEKKNIVQMLIY